MQHSKELHWVDFIRGISAQLVFWGHLRALLFLGFDQNTSINSIGKTFYLITGLGHQAVIIFFVLSGFFIIQSITNGYLQQQWNPCRYLFNRFSRLWIVLIPALLATFCWDSLGLILFPQASGYVGAIPTLPGLPPSGKQGWDIFLGNLFFTQNILVPTYGSNAALWSLANEFWYYLLFPALFFTISPHYTWRIRLGLLVLVLLIFIFIGRGIASGFTIWVMGGLVYFALKKQWKWLESSIFRLGSILLFLVVLAGIRLGWYPHLLHDYSLGLVTTLFLISLLKFKMHSTRLQRLSLWLSEISYSVYLFHLPVAAFMAAWMVPDRQVFTLAHFFLYITMGIIILIYCILAYWLFERNTNSIKSRLLKLTQTLKA